MALDLAFDDHGWEDYLWWQAHDRKVLAKISALIKEARRTPGEGQGKPEQLRYGSPDTWSRRVTLEHRLVYRVIDGHLVVLQCRYHH